MAMLIAIIGLLLIFAAAILLAVKPVWVFYLFLFSTVYGNIFYGYIGQAGKLGMVRTWQPSDVIAWLLLIAAARIHPNQSYGSNLLKRCFVVLAVLTAAALLLGLVRNIQSALPNFRTLYFIPAMLFANRYFTTETRVKNFMRFAALLLMSMFVVHIFIRAGIFTPPMSELAMFTKQLGGERGEMSLVMTVYLALMGIAIGKMTSKTGSLLWSGFLLFASLVGIALSESRSLYGAAAVAGLTVIVLARGRFKNIIILGLVGVAMFWVFAKVGFEVTSRFRASGGTGEIINPLSESKYRGSWRQQEYFMIIDSYKKEPHFLLTGRGIGAMHYAWVSKEDVWFYHSEYLGYLDKFGLLGFAAFAVIWLGTLIYSFRLIRKKESFLVFLGIATFVSMVGLAANGVFHPIFVDPQGGALLITFAAIISNWKAIYDSIYANTSGLEEIPDDNASDYYFEQESYV